jgi:hypothetical protein
MYRPISGAFLMLVLAIGALRPAEAAPGAPPRDLGISLILMVQGWRDHCRWLWREVRDLEARVAYAPPLERPRLQRRLEHRRREWWRDCR